jgi:hypothetical protein
MSNFHVITTTGQKAEVLDMDLQQEKVITPSGYVPFSEISREPEH